MESGYRRSLAHEGLLHRAHGRHPNGEDSVSKTDTPQGAVGSTPTPSAIARSFNGRTLGSDPSDGGSTPPLAAMHNEDVRVSVDVVDRYGNKVHTMMVRLRPDHTVDVTVDGEPVQSVDYDQEFRRLRRSISRRGLTFDEVESESPQPPPERRVRHKGRVTVDINKRVQRQEREYLNRLPNPGRS